MARSPLLTAQRSKSAALSTLSEAEQTYVEARINGSAPVVAARIAGMDPPDERAMALERDERVKQAVAAAVKVATLEKTLTREDVLAGLMDAVNMAATATEMVAAWREVGKVIGAYEPQKIDMTITTRQQMEQMDDDDLLRAAAIEGEFELVEFTEADDSQSQKPSSEA